MIDYSKRTYKHRRYPDRYFDRGSRHHAVPLRQASSGTIGGWQKRDRRGSFERERRCRDARSRRNRSERTTAPPVSGTPSLHSVSGATHLQRHPQKAAGAFTRRNVVWDFVVHSGRAPRMRAVGLSPRRALRLWSKREGSMPTTHHNRGPAHFRCFTYYSGSMPVVVTGSAADLCG